MINIIPIIVIVANMQAVQPVFIHKPEIDVELTPRTADQMGSFYEARGFPKSMLNILKKQCFISIRIKNISKKKIWFDLEDWTFTSDGKSIKRKDRHYWKDRWQTMGIPLSKQSTFRWTLIPETLDYLPGEREGGNILLPFTPGMISVNAIFKTGENKKGKKLTITTDKLFCAEDAR